MNTLEGNKLIAEFLGFKMINDLQISTPNGGGAFLSELQYHTSWDWLMPVVEKIESLSTHSVVIRKSLPPTTLCVCTISNPENEFLGMNESKIEAIYKAVLEFIQWYNTQQ